MFKIQRMIWMLMTAFTSIFLTACQTGALKKEAISLFNGEDLSGWRQPLGNWKTAKTVSLKKSDPHLFDVTPGHGLFINGDGHEQNLMSLFEHGDCEAHIEFCVSSNSNSGIYFQGRYEIQILDSWGVEHPKYGDCGGIYQRWENEQGYEGHAPLVNASKRPGEWQMFDVIFRAPRFDAKGKKFENARFVKVVHNGKLIHKNVEVTGPTRSPAFNEEKPSDPLMLQGDHGPVAFRNMWLRPIEIK